MPCKACFSLFIFCLDYLSIGVSGVLKSPTIIVLLSISPFMAVSICLMYWGDPMLGAQIFTIVISSSRIDPFIIVQCTSLCLLVVLFWKSILSDVSIATPPFFWFPFAWYIFFHPLPFSLYVSLGLKWVSCRQPIYRSCFFCPISDLFFLLFTQKLLFFLF